MTDFKEELREVALLLIWIPVLTLIITGLFVLLRMVAKEFGGDAALFWVGIGMGLPVVAGLVIFVLVSKKSPS